jgi:hypothetical protein
VAPVAKGAPELRALPRLELDEVLGAGEALVGRDWATLLSPTGHLDRDVDQDDERRDVAVAVDDLLDQGPQVEAIGDDVPTGRDELQEEGGAILALKELLPTATVLKSDGGTNPHMSRVATYYMRDHVEELRGIYRQKRDTMLDALRSGLGDQLQVGHPEGGFFLWIRLPEGTDPEKLLGLALICREVVVLRVIARGVDLIRT